MVANQLEKPSTRLLKHIIRCYNRLAENPRARMALKENLPILLRELRLQDNLDDSSKKCLKNLNEIIQNEVITPGNQSLSLISGISNMTGLTEYTDGQNAFSLSMSHSDSYQSKDASDFFQGGLGTSLRPKTPLQDNISSGGMGSLYSGFQPQQMIGTSFSQPQTIPRPPSTNLLDKSQIPQTGGNPFQRMIGSPPPPGGFQQQQPGQAPAPMFTLNTPSTSLYMHQQPQ